MNKLSVLRNVIHDVLYDLEDRSVIFLNDVKYVVNTGVNNVFDASRVLIIKLLELGFNLANVIVESMFSALRASVALVIGEKTFEEEEKPFEEEKEVS